MEKSPKVSLIKLLPRERILLLQRQHKVAIILPLTFLALLFLFIAMGIFVAVNIQNFNVLFPKVFALSVYLFLVAACFFLTVSAFLFMRWFYQFYIITNKRIVHVHFFRFGGFHLDEVILGATIRGEIERYAPNPIFDFFGIENFYVFFRRTERPEPFVFSMPEDAEQIDEQLSKISIIEERRHG